MRIDPPDAYWKKDVALFLSRRFALLIKMLYPVAIIAPVAASDIPARYAAAVVGIVAIMAGTFGAGESLTNDLNDGILARVALTPISPYRLVFEVLAVNAVLDLVQLIPALVVVFLLHPAPPIWVFIANFTSSPADVLLYATAILFPLIYVSGSFRNQSPTGVLATLREFVPFAYTNDAMKTVFGLATETTPLEVFVYPALICAVVVAGVCLTAPRLLSPRL